MADVGFRDLIGSFAPGRRMEPTVAPPQHEAMASPVERAPRTPVAGPAAPPKPALFGPDRRPADALGMEPVFARLAELLLHRRTATPLTIGIGGAPGSGKSVALERIVGGARTLAANAADLAETSFTSPLHVATIDAAALEGEPVLALAARLHSSLREPYPDLAREIGHLARDPHAALRDCNDKLDEARRRLDGERRALDDAGSRRARLVETVLYETSGSAVDAYARAHRTGLERRFAGFGIGGDTLRTYKDFVLAAAAPGGRLALALRALWAFRGQLKLIVGAFVLVALGIGLGIASETRETWLADLRGGSQAGAGVATWMQNHAGLLPAARTAAFVIAALCIASNLWRAFAFTRPISRGTALLGSDLDGRRRDLDGLYAHQTKRVDALESDVERLTRDAGAAERRADGHAEPSPFEPAGANTATALFDAVAKAMRRAPDRSPAAPGRVLLVLDHLDAVAPERARALLSAVGRGPGEGIVMLVALDTERLAAVAGDEVRRCIDVPVTVSPADAQGDLVARLLGLRDEAPSAPRAVDAATSSLDAPLEASEADLLGAVAPLAGSTPRALRRFVDLYRLARLEEDVPRGALALALAAALGGTVEERERLARAFRSGAGFERPENLGERLRAACDAAARFDGAALDGDARMRAARAARRYGFTSMRVGALTGDR